VDQCLRFLLCARNEAKGRRETAPVGKIWL
jgi:hypothetical protein